MTITTITKRPSVSVQDQKSFVDYCEGFYGDFATRDDIWGALVTYLTGNDERFFYEGEHSWGGGDTTDREIIFDLLKENKE